MRKTGIAKRLLVYITAAAVIVGSGLAGTGFESAAASYIQYDNIIIRDAANGEILGGIAKGTEVEILESATGTDGKQWNHVKYAANGTTHEGWVRADLMTDDKSKIEPDEEEIQETQDPQETVTPDMPDEETDEDESSGLEVVIPDQSVSGEGYESTGDKAFTVCGVTMTIAEDFSDDKIPSNFEKKDISYGDGTVKGLKYKYGDVSLVYLKNQSGKGEFFVLDAEKDVVYSFIRVSAGNNELILLVPPADSAVATSYGKTLYATDEDTAVTAYQFTQQAELMDVGTNPAEYFYVYGITESGVPDWYLLDDGEKTFVRATTDLTVELDALSGTEIVVQNMDDGSSLEKMIIVVMAAIILICIVLIIIFGVRSRRARNGYCEEEEEEYEDEDEDDMGFIQRRREDRKYRRFMENFEEEGDEDVADLLPQKKVEAYLKQDEEPIQEPIPQETTVLPPVDTVVLKEIMAEQEKAAEEQRVAELAAKLELERAVAQEMAMDDYDIPVSDKDDYDLTDDNSEEDEKEFDEIEKETAKVEKQKIQPEDEWKDLEFLDI